MVKVLYRQEHGYNVAVYPDDHEPAHVHVWKDNLDIKVFLDPIAFGENPGFKATDLKRKRKLVAKHKDRLFAQWVEYHGIPHSEGH